jgi:glycine oxidase
MSPSSRTAPHVAVLGGGIIGLSIAWSLAARGCRVDVVDVGRHARQGGRDSASWASAGLLAADVDDDPVDDALRRLCRRSRVAWPAFAARLEAESGVPVGLRTEGTLVAALSAADVTRLEAAYARHDALGTRQAWLTREAVARCEPALATSALAARFLPDDHQVDPRAVLVALRDAVRARGGVIRTLQADSVLLDRERPAMRGEGWYLEADYLVLAGGAWMQELGGVPEAWRLPVRPVKGQMLAVEMADGRPLLQHAVFTARGYLVPRASGRVLVGGTSEECGFAGGVTAGGMASLLDAARAVAPAIGNARVVETWFGFRPATADGLPIIGWRDERVLVASGHFRNGILLAPATADAIAGAILEGDLRDWVLPFTPVRFDAALLAAR